MKRIVVVVEGGLVKEVLCSEATEVVIVDYDVDGLDEDEISTVFGSSAYVGKLTAEIADDDIEEAFEVANG